MTAEGLADFIELVVPELEARGLICDADEDLLFDEDHEHKWTRALAKLGITADHLSATAGRA